MPSVQIRLMIGSLVGKVWARAATGTSDVARMARRVFRID